MQTDRAGGIGPLMATFLVTTTMIGSGIYMLPAVAAPLGSIAILGWLFAALGAIVVGLTLAFLAQADCGSSFLESIGRQLGPVTGLAATVFYQLSVLVSLPMVAVAAAGYIGFLFPAAAQHLGKLWIAIGFIWLFVAIAWGGARLIARFGSVSLIVGLVPILLLATLGWRHFDMDLFRASWNISGQPDAAAALQSTIILFMAYLGLETASVVCIHIRNPERNVPIATVGGIAIATLVYIASTTVISGLIPAATLAKSAAPFADAAVLMFGTIAAVAVAACAAAKAAGTLGALQLAMVEAVVVMRRQMDGGAASRGLANIGIGLLATLLAFATDSPDLAAQFGLLSSAVVSFSFFCFILAGIALARLSTGLKRLTGLLASAICLGLTLAQPAEALRLTGWLLAGTLLLVLALLAWRRRALAAA